MKNKSLFPLIILLILGLTACKSPVTPTATVVLTATSTASPTQTPTVVPTPTTTPIPATPAGADGLNYDPETRSLNNPQGTPVFILAEDGDWQAPTPEVPEGVMAGLEEDGYTDISVENSEEFGVQIITGEDLDGDGKRDILGVYTEKYGWEVEGIGADQGFFGKGDHLEKHEGDIYVINEYGVASGVWENGEWGKYTPELDVVGKRPRLETIYDGIYEGTYQKLENEANVNVEKLIIKAEENRLYDKDGNKIPYGYYGQEDGGEYQDFFYFSGFIGASEVVKVDDKNMLVWMMIVPGKYRNQGVIFFSPDQKNGDDINMRLPKESGVFPKKIDEDGAGKMLEWNRISYHNEFLMLSDNDFKGKQIVVSFDRNVSNSPVTENYQDEYDGLMEALEKKETYDDDDDAYFMLQRLILERELFDLYNN